MTLTTVQVYDSWSPAGLAGDTVQIDVSQILGDLEGQANLLTTTGANSIHLKLDAPQVSLSPDQVIGVYPAGGSATSPAEFVPHIAISRYTLPWERVGPAAGIPWLALILFKPSDLPAPIETTPLFPIALKTPTVAPNVAAEAVTAAALKAGGGATVQTNPPPPVATPATSTGTTLLQATVSQLQSIDPTGFGQLTNTSTGCGIDPSTPVNALILPGTVWAEIAPQLDEIALGCHVRMGSNDGATGCIIGNRLPTLPSQSGVAPEPHTAVLVSLEKRSDLFPNKRAATAKVALIGLYYWTFTPSAGLDFADAIQAIHLQPNGGVLRFGNLPQAPAAGATAPLTAGFDAAVGSDGYLETPLQTSMGAAASYRGPLRPFTTPPRENTFAVHSAPQPFTNAPAGTPPDYSYTSAFELGRLMALSDAGIVEDLREVHGVLDLPKNFFGVEAAPPQALLVKSWSQVGADWFQEPWSGAVGEPAPPANADVSGIGSQIPGWSSSIGLGMQGVASQNPGETGIAGGVVAQVVNIDTVDAATLAAEFSDLVIAGS